MDASPPPWPLPAPRPGPGSTPLSNTGCFSLVVRGPADAPPNCLSCSSMWSRSRWSWSTSWDFEPSKRSVQVTLWYRLNVWSWQILPPFHPIQLPDVVHREQNHFIHFIFSFDETKWNNWFQGPSGATHLQVIQMIVQQHFSIGDAFLRPKKNKWHQALWERAWEDLTGWPVQSWTNLSHGEGKDAMCKALLQGHTSTNTKKKCCWNLKWPGGWS